MQMEVFILLSLRGVEQSITGDEDLILKSTGTDSSSGESKHS